MTLVNPALRHVARLSLSISNSSAALIQGVVAGRSSGPQE